MKDTFPKLPKGFRWVRRGEWVSGDDSQGVFNDEGNVTWRKVWDCFPFSPHTWKPHKCRTKHAYIRNIRPKAKR